MPVKSKTLSLRKQLTTMVVFSIIAVASPLKADITVRVHMIDARTGEHIPKKPVRMWIMNSPGHWRPGYLEEKTDATGVATFHMGGTTPSHLDIHIGMGGRWEQCSPNDRPGYSVEEVLSSGVSREGFCGKLPIMANKYHANPGEVYIFAVHLTFGERLREPRG